MAEVEVSDTVSTKRPKAKANGATKAPSKAAGKPKAQAKGKAPAKAKAAPKAAAKATKPKAAKAKADGAKKDAFGFREGSAKSLAAAMYAAKSGATLEEVKNKVGSIQLNVLHSLEAEGHKVERVKEDRDGRRPATRYFLKAKK